jgi:S1-C subfamily serine protease
VVRIDSAGFGGRGTGTGFVVDPGGVVVTNAHVVGDARTVSVSLADGTELDGDVVGRDARFDLAVVQVDRDGLPYLQLGDSDELEVGDPVVAIGNALGLAEGSGATVTTGIVSGLDRVIDLGDETLYNAIQTDAAINPGNSGGPLLDMNGRVVGINTAIASPGYSNNVGFAISISSAKPVIDALREGRQPKVAFLGVSTEDVTPRLADEIGVERGAVVTTVTPGSAADDAGLEPKDVIVEIDGSPVDEALDVVSAVRSHQPGDRLELTFVRDGDRRTVTVTLGERPDDL